MRHEYRKLWRDRQGYRMGETYCGMEMSLGHEKRPKHQSVHDNEPCEKCLKEIRKKNPLFLPAGLA